MSNTFRKFCGWYGGNGKEGEMAMQILLVEDNVTIAKGLIYSLEQKEYSVVHAENIEKALDVIYEQTIDLVILDISLPDGNRFWFI